MSRRRPPRGLRPDEQELWRRVAESARPLAARSAQPAPVPPDATGPATPAPEPARPERALPPETQPARIAPFRIGELRGSATLPTPPAPRPEAAHPPRMDAKAYRRLSGGRMRPEARIDLHGLTLAEAQPALARFLIGAHAANNRLVLVITGKGRGGDGEGPLPRRVGALRHEVPMWLSRPPLAALVQEVMPAHARHGGGGALYVYLRRRR